MQHSEREREDSIDNKTKDKKFASGLFVDTGVEHSKLCGKRNERYRLVFAGGGLIIFFLILYIVVIPVDCG